MDHKELRKKVNQELERSALAGLSPDPDKKITSGLSTGSMVLNNALSGSPLIGFVWGRIIEIYGPEQSGKTTLALHAIREAQRIEQDTGGSVPCLFVDAEHALDTYYAECLGIDLNNLSISQPDCVFEGEYILTNKGYIELKTLSEESAKINSVYNHGSELSGFEIVNSMEKQCFEVIASCGFGLFSKEHRFKTLDGYTSLGNLKVGDWIAHSVKPKFKLSGLSNIDSRQAEILGFLIAYGYYATETIMFTNIDLDLIDRLDLFIKEYHTDCGMVVDSIKSFRVSKIKRNSCIKSSFSKYFHNLLGYTRSPNKKVPLDLFDSSEEALAGFVRGLWCCDGTVTATQLQFDNSCKNIIMNTSAILNFFDIPHRMTRCVDRRKESYLVMYRISINSKEGITNFKMRIGLIGVKQQRLDAIDLDFKESFVAYPPELWGVIFGEFRKTNKTLGDWSEIIIGNRRKDGSHLFNIRRGLSLSYLDRINRHLKSSKIQSIIDSNVYYSRINHIHKNGVLPTKDIHVFKHNNFVCNNMLVHNCGEDALNEVEAAVKMGFKVIVVDSVAALTPRAEIDGEMGESVPADTPILIRKNGAILSITSIASLFKGTHRFYGKRHTNRYKKLKSIEVYTHNGWSKVIAVVLKRNRLKKSLVVTSSMRHLAITTKDHSLYVNGSEKSPVELDIGDVLDHKLPEISKESFLINKDLAWCLGYFCAEGHKRQATNLCFNVKSIDESNIRIFKTKSYFMDSCIDFKTKEKKVPDYILQSPLDVVRSFLDGFRLGDGNMAKEEYCFYTSSYLLLSGLTFLLTRLHLDYRINSNYRKERNNKIEFVITEVKTEHVHNPLEINKFVDLPAPKFLYDIETEEGTFVGGVGGVIHHNSHMGLQARLMSQAMRKLTAIVKKSGAILIFINQIRMKIGIVFGNPEVTTGGAALKFYATYRLEIRSPRSGKKTGKSLMGYGEDETVEIGTVTNVKVVKNKVFPPHRKATFYLEYGKGIDKIKDVISFLELAGMFKSPGKDKSGKAKPAVIRIPSKKKLYTVKGLPKVLADPEVQKDVLNIIKDMED